MDIVTYLYKSFVSLNVANRHILTMHIHIHQIFKYVGLISSLYFNSASIISEIRLHQQYSLVRNLAQERFVRFIHYVLMTNPEYRWICFIFKSINQYSKQILMQQRDLWIIQVERNCNSESKYFTYNGTLSFFGS